MPQYYATVSLYFSAVHKHRGHAPPLVDTKSRALLFFFTFFLLTKNFTHAFATYNGDRYTRLTRHVSSKAITWATKYCFRKARSLAGSPLALTRNMCFRHDDRAFSNGEHRAADPAEQHGLGQLGMGKQHAKSVGYVLFPLALTTPFCLCLEITRAVSRYLPPHVLPAGAG